MKAWDVYLGGLAERAWRETFKNEVSADISIFDPLVEDYDELDDAEVTDLAAKELIYMQENCAIIVFYLNEEWQGTSSLIEIGDAVGRGSQVTVCIEGKVTGAEKIRRYCEFHGVPMAADVQDLITTVESYIGELALCSEDELAI